MGPGSRILPAVRLLPFRTILAALAVLATGACGGGPPGLKGKNLLLISIDTLRADHTSPYGRKIDTPALQRLADEGVLFERALSPVPLTQPAHTSLFTGNYPGRHGVRDNAGTALSADAVTLAECLRAAGYATGAVVAASPIARRTGLDQGFDSYDDQFGASAFDSAQPIVERAGEEVRARALAWLAARDPGRPFALFVHFYDPHGPHEPPPDLRARYGRRSYEGEVVHADRCVGALIAELERGGILDDTLVVLLSDHGEALGEHGEETHGLFVYECVLRVPLILRLPGAHGPRGKRVAATVSLIDVMPTLLELLELPPPPMEGQSLAALVRGEAIAERDLFAETHYPLFYRWSPSYSVQRGMHKYIRAPRPELYDLAADPDEHDNLLPREPALALALEAAVTGRLAQWAAGTATAESAESLASLEAMAALGYAAGAAADPALAGELPDMKDRVAQYADLSAAMTLMGEQRWKEAGKRLEAALAADPSNPSAHLNLGNVLMRTGDPEGAERHLRASLELLPDNPMAQASLGMLCFFSQRLDEAQVLFERILAVAPASPEPLYFLGQVRELRSDFAGALECYQKAKALAPNLPGIDERLRAVERR